MILEFSTRRREDKKAKTAARQAARRLAASKPRNSKNGTPEERAAKTALRKEKRLAWFQDFGIRLRVTRLELGITEVEAAAACLITLRTYRRREAGLPFIGWPEGLSSFVEKYNLTYDWMLCGEGNMYINPAAKALGDQRRQSRPVLTVVCGGKPANTQSAGPAECSPRDIEFVSLGPRK